MKPRPRNFVAPRPSMASRCSVKLAFASLGACIFSCATASAQTVSFPKPDYFRQAFATPPPRVELQPPVSVQEFIVDSPPEGKHLELSVKSYLQLVMANNTDIALQRLTVEPPRNQILRAHALFDPVASASWTSNRTSAPSSSQLQGATEVNSLTQPGNFQVSQFLPTGTSYTATFADQKLSSNSQFQNYNPSLTAALGISFSQALLKNRGKFVNRIPIMAAKGRFQQSELNLRGTLIGLVSDAENAYWDVVLARDNLRVQEQALDLAKQALKRAQQELDLGAMSPLDIYNPQQNQAVAEINVAQAKFQLKQREDVLRKEMGVDLSTDARVLPIKLTESVEVVPTNIDSEQQVSKALATRPELQAAHVGLGVDDLNIRLATNNLRPDLELVGGYNTQGQGGPFYVRDANNNVVNVVPGGFGDTLGQLFSGGFPGYYFGLQLKLPLKNRQASADLADFTVNRKTDQLNLRNLQQGIRLDTLTAVTQVESSRVSVELARTALGFARQYLDAEQKKYELGTSTIYFVLQAQNALVNADSALVQNSIAYRRSLLTLLRRTGELLDARGIVVQ